MAAPELADPNPGPPQRTSLTLMARALHRLAAPGRGVADNATSHPGMAAAVELHVQEGEPVVLISAYGLIDGGSSQTALHRLVSDLEPLLNSAPAKRVLLGGDLNSGDQPYDHTLPMHELLWQRIALLGLRNICRRIRSRAAARVLVHPG